MSGLAKGAPNDNDPRNIRKGIFYEDEDPTTPLSLEEALEMVNDAEDEAGDALRQLFASPYNINANNSNNAAAIVSAEEAANSAREATVAVLKAAINASAEVSNSIKAANKAKAAMNKVRERAARNRDEEEKTRKELEALMAIKEELLKLIKIGGKQAGENLVKAAGRVLTETKKVRDAVVHKALVPTIGAAVGGVKAALAMLEGATLRVLRGADEVAGKALNVTGRVAVAGLGAAGRGANVGLRAAGRGAMAGLGAAGRGAMAGLRVAGNAATRRLNALFREASPPNQPVRAVARAVSRNRAFPAAVPFAPQQNNPNDPAAGVGFPAAVAVAPQPNPSPTMAPQASSRFTAASAAPSPGPSPPSSTSMNYNSENTSNNGSASPGPSSGAASGVRLRQRAGPNQRTLSDAGVPVHASLKPGAEFRPAVLRGVRGAPLVPMSLGSRGAIRKKSIAERRGQLNEIHFEAIKDFAITKLHLTLDDSMRKKEIIEKILSKELENKNITLYGGTRKKSHKKRNNTKRRK